MKYIFLLIFILLVLIISLGCNKPIEYPNEPIIKFLSLVKLKSLDPNSLVKDSAVVLIEFTDGDGDLGLPVNEKEKPKINSNFFYRVFKKKDNVWNEISLPPNSTFAYPFEAWIPTLNKTGKKRPLKGKISADVSPAFAFFSKNDTIRLEIFVKDNTRNISNSITTTELQGFQ